jgi:general stress protein YciG
MAKYGFKDVEVARAAGRKGGEKCKELHSEDYYSKIGSKGGKGLVKTRGKQFMAEIGRKGGLARAARMKKEAE